ncbi:helix-turn-helix domain-containing protein [Streptomyces sp. NPDC001380]|uniref:helix-turn-helix domain-containing protein n=1 Tax=Streptomyces sp. NPDC001380 TaxID=3364566 RepID=UPI003690A0A3
MTIGKSPLGDNRRSDTAAPGSAPTMSGSSAIGRRRPPVPASFQPPAEAVPAAAPLPTIGRILASARIDAALTVDQVSSATRVRVPIVHAIEEDDYSRCGGDFYARGHIRAIARYVGVDGDALVARYDAEHGGAPSSARPAQIFEAERIRTERRRPNWTAAMVAAIVAVVALIGFNLASGRGAGHAEKVASTPLPSRKASAPVTVRPTPPATPRTESPIAAAPADRVTVKLVAQNGDSWVSAIDSQGNTLFQKNLQSGEDQTFTDPRRIRLVLGNAGAVHLYVNGKDLGPAGPDGQVVRLTYTPGDPEAA